MEEIKKNWISVLADLKQIYSRIAGGDISKTALEEQSIKEKKFMSFFEGYKSVIKNYSHTDNICDSMNNFLSVADSYQSIDVLKSSISQLLNTLDIAIEQLSQELQTTSHNISIEASEVNIGDKFSNINGNIITRSNNFQNKQKNNGLKNLLIDLSNIVEKSKSKEAKESLNDLIEEINTTNPKKSKIKAFGNAIKSSLPNILNATEIIEKIIGALE